MAVKKNMKSDLYIITGASSGFGKSIALQALKKKHFVISLSRSTWPQKEIQKFSQNFFQIQIDFSKPFQKKAEFQLKKVLSSIDFKNIQRAYLINNAGVVEPIDRIEKLTEKNMIQHLQINLVAPAIMTGLFLRFFSQKKIEKIVVQITSGAATRPVEGWSVYCAGKAGLNMFNQVLSLQQQPEISFKAVGYSPGVMDTAMQNQIRTRTSKQFPEVSVFKKYKAEKQLRSTDYVANDLMNLIENPQKLQSGQIYRVGEKASP